MADNRLSRELENREKSERKKSWAPPTTLPEPSSQPGWTFRWIRTSLMGQADPTNSSAKFREGWEPVKAVDHPELAMQANSSGNIENGGLLLCKAPTELMEQRKAHYANQSSSQMEAVDNNFLRQNDERMPLFSEKRSTTSFGRGK